MTHLKSKPRRRRGSASTAVERGFSLAELLVAMAVFLVISAAAFSLVRQHIPLFAAQQNQIALNYAMRNAAAQFQIDVANAGAGYYVGANIPVPPPGLIVKNSLPTEDCHDSSTYTYGPECFDELKIVTFDNILAHPTDNGANCQSTTSSNVFITPADPSVSPATLASSFKENDVVMLMKSDGSQMSTAVLTKDGQVTGGKVKLQHNPNPGLPANGEDVLGIFGGSTQNKLGDTFCPADWVLKLSSNYVSYHVNASDPSNPKLVRTQGSGAEDTIAEGIIGFKVGASVWNDTTGTDSEYKFNASTYSSAWSDIRSVRISLIARSPADSSGRYRNGFDGGPYKIQSVSVVVSPRNLSMNDSGAN